MIRDANYEDIEDVFDLGHSLWLESNYRHLPWDNEKARRMGHVFIERDDKYFRIVEKDEKIIAFCMGGLSDYIFSEGLFAEEYLLYTEKKAPLSGAKLMRDFEKWARQWGALEMNFSTTAYGEDPRYEAFCTRLGYEPCGRNWKRRL